MAVRRPLTTQARDGDSSGAVLLGGGGQEGLCLGYREVLLITLTGGSSESCEGGGQLWMTAKLFFF